MTNVTSIQQSMRDTRVWEMDPVVRYILLGYLAAWAVFLLTRWHQTDVALSTIKEELRYYLID
ncbi:MAG TPA: hypothetical protein VFO72_05235 [Pyrinomonadaceae bacterium]|nr:hypothetical protein [Pyrinomonadaceae bacterium]